MCLQQIAYGVYILSAVAPVVVAYEGSGVAVLATLIYVAILLSNSLSFPSVEIIIFKSNS